MEQKTEILQYNDKVPLRLYSCRFNYIPSHWHQGIEIILILHGQCSLLLNDRLVNLKEDDIFLINKNIVHELRSESECSLVSLEIEIDKIPDFDNELSFSLDSSVAKNQHVFDKIKRYIATLAQEPVSSSTSYLKNRSIAYSILYELSAHFLSEEKSSSSLKYVKRLNDILRYIEDHYREGLTFNEIAEAHHFSVPYLSSFFRNHLGVSFQTYYKDFRLERASEELLHSSSSIEEIASNNGYPNPRAFVSAFKEKYGTLPSIYRKKVSKEVSSRDAIPDEELYSKSTRSLLGKYLSSEPIKKEKESSLSSVKLVSEENIDVSKVIKELNHNFRIFTSVGRAKELLYSDVQKMLRELQEEVHFKYIKFHGLLSDDMLVYSEDEHGNPLHSFVYIDKVMDFLLSINLRPLIEFSFMPKLLATDPNRTAYYSPYVLSMPKSMDKWVDLVSDLTRHLIERYGLKEVRSWLFCCWNEPDTSTHLFGFEKDEDYYSLYKATYEAIKKIDNKLVFGSPSLLISYNINQKWCERYIGWCKANSLIPDFMNIHYYDNDFDDESFEGHRPAKPLHSRLNRDENSFSKCIVKTKNLFKSWGIGNLPIYLTEWNLTVSHRNLLNDTCFKSCYLAKNLLENYDKLDSFGYWVLTDMIEETMPSKEQFHGGLGLFTYSGIKKPHYYAISFINKLGDYLLKRGDGYFISKSERKITIIAYNYEHFNHLFAEGEHYDIDFTERYTPFNKLGPMEISLDLTNIDASSCLIREQILNQTYGSAFDEWIKMGALPLSQSDIDYLKSVSVPKRYVRKETIENGQLSINASLEPLEVRLIEIELNQL